MLTMYILEGNMEQMDPVCSVLSVPIPVTTLVCGYSRVRIDLRVHSISIPCDVNGLALCFERVVGIR